MTLRRLSGGEAALMIALSLAWAVPLLFHYRQPPGPYRDQDAGRRGQPLGSRGDTAAPAARAATAAGAGSVSD